MDLPDLILEVLLYFLITISFLKLCTGVFALTGVADLLLLQVVIEVSVFEFPGVIRPPSSAAGWTAKSSCAAI